MKVAFYTYDLFPGREHLMPWRTLFEVAKVMKENGYYVCILNACYDDSVREDYEWQEIQIKALAIGYDKLAEEFVLNPVEALFVPFTWRDGLKNISAFNRITCRKIAYMAGGVYNFQGAYALLKAGGKMLAKPYFIESLTPKFCLTNALKKVCFSHVIGFTEFTAKKAIEAGFQNTHAIFPGNDNFSAINNDDSLLRKYSLIDKKWFLFSGAPIAYRGASTLLKAVDEAKNESLRVVFLIRKDAGKQYLQFFDNIEKAKHKERFVIIQEKCSREQLKSFFEKAYYALLPFIVIPSEIPLTYFELLSCGTPVITFKNGGTTEYLRDSLLIAEKSVKGLAKVLDKAWSDDTLRKQLSENGIKKMSGHPTWEQVGLQWIDTLIRK